MTDRPPLFRRGTSLIQTLTIENSFANGYFANWLPLAQVRVANNVQPDGLIATLDCAWEDAMLTRKMGIRINNTEGWPAGLIQLDLLLTSPSGESYRTPPMVFDCVPGVTEVTP